MFKDMFSSGTSWRTTIGGITLIASGVFLAAAMLMGKAEFSPGNISMVMGSLGGGSALIAAKDSKVSGVKGAVNPIYAAVTPLTQSEAETIGKPE